MEKLLKFFPLMPAAKDTAKLVWAIVFYALVPPIACGIVGFILGVTVILAPLAFVVGIAGTAYTAFGIVCAILSYIGKDLNEVFSSKKDGGDK